MGKELSEMSLEELWELFPIILTEHQTIWQEWYAAEEKRLSAILDGQSVKRISHIGSTAIPSIWAKPIIDILVELCADAECKEVKKILLRNGYLCMSQHHDRASFNKGYTENGFAEQVFHLHLRYEGDNDELYFRDYLQECPSVAKEYERIKLDLWKRFEHDRDGYTDAKTEFVKTYTEIAKKQYPNRY